MGDQKTLNAAFKQQQEVTGKKHGHITVCEKMSVNSTVVTPGSMGPLALAK